MANNNESTRKVSVEMLCMMLLSEADMYGYEMSQEIYRRSGNVIFIPEGSLYITMYKLVDKGYVTDRKQMVGSRGSRLRVYYHLEPSGREYLKGVTEEYLRVAKGISDFMAACKSDKEG